MFRPTGVGSHMQRRGAIRITRIRICPRCQQGAQCTLIGIHRGKMQRAGAQFGSQITCARITFQQALNLACTTQSCCDMDRGLLNISCVPTANTVLARSNPKMPNRNCAFQCLFVIVTSTEKRWSRVAAWVNPLMLSTLYLAS